MKSLAALLFTALAAAADDPVDVLMRVRDKVMAHAEQVPNHTCVETIARDWYEYLGVPAPKSCDALLGRRKRAGVGTLIRLATTDRLRLDVALADSREIYSWAGARKFDAREIDELVPPGAIGTGPFAATLLAIFEIRDPSFVFEGETVPNGRRLLEYSFSVSEEQSHYKVKAGEQWLIAAYTGTLLVDPLTAELVRLSVRTEELPAATHACEVESTHEYGAVRLGDKDYLLPKLTRERFIEQDGSEAENTITFASCRDFRGESTLSFGENAVAGPPPAAPNSPVDLPAGLPVTVELTSTIQADQAAAGDRIEGRLAAPIRDAKKQTILVPEGAAVEGRLMRVETRYGSPTQLSIALRLETLEVNGVKAPFSVTPDRTAGSQRPYAPGALRQRPITFELPRPGEGSYAVFRFSDEHIVIKSGLRSQWFTVKP